MKHDQVRATILDIIEETAPDLDARDIDPAARLREDVGLDSIDFLDIISRIYEVTGVEIPERDYDDVASIDRMTEYVVEHAGMARPGAPR